MLCCPPSVEHEARRQLRLRRKLDSQDKLKGIPQELREVLDEDVIGERTALLVGVRASHDIMHLKHTELHHENSHGILQVAESETKSCLLSVHANLQAWTIRKS